MHNLLLCIQSFIFAGIMGGLYVLVSWYILSKETKINGKDK